MDNDIVQRMLARLETAEVRLCEMENRMREMEAHMNELEERVDKMEQVFSQTSRIINLRSRGDVIVIFSVHHVPFAVAVIGADDLNDAN